MAGGTLAAVGCSGPTNNIHSCNANPDPCCNDQVPDLCADKKACEARGGKWDDFLSVDDGGMQVHACTPVDAGTPDAK